MRISALIRTHRIGPAELAMRKQLASYFGEHVHFVVENFFDQDGRDVPPAGGRAIVMSSAFLAEYGLARFARAGWQCGDYSYYAAATRLPDYDACWLVEPDVTFTFEDIGDFFKCYETSDADLLMYGVSPKAHKWQWYESMQTLVAGKVYGGPFPLTRMTRRAALHLLAERTRYCQSDVVQNLPADFKGGGRFANDESFTASILMRDGFICESLEDQALPGAFSAGTFTTSVPIMPEEVLLPEARNKVFHPVCDSARAGPKLRRLKKVRPVLFERRRREIIGKFGAEAWQAWAGLTPGGPASAGGRRLRDRRQP